MKDLLLPHSAPSNIAPNGIGYVTSWIQDPCLGIVPTAFLHEGVGTVLVQNLISHTISSSDFFRRLHRHTTMVKNKRPATERKQRDQRRSRRKLTPSNKAKDMAERYVIVELSFILYPVVVDRIIFAVVIAVAHFHLILHHTTGYRKESAPLPTKRQPIRKSKRA